MTSVSILKRKVEKLEEQLAPKRKGCIAVTMWSPDGGSDGKGGDKTILMEVKRYA